MQKRTKNLKIIALLMQIALFLMLYGNLVKTPISYGFPGSIDFIQYWTSNLLIEMGENPYNVNSMLKAENILGLKSNQAIMMWCPPWTLTILKPFLLFKFKNSFIIFLFFNIAALIFSIFLLQITYNKNETFTYKTCTLALFFLPAWDCINYGQISIVLLLALCLANYFLMKENKITAGIFFAILSIKPHLFIYLALATLVWAYQNKKSKVIFSTLFFTTLLVTSSYLQNTKILEYWIDSMLNYGSAGAIKTSNWAPATIGTWLRYLLGVEKIYLMWLPCLISLCYLVYQTTKKYFLNKSYQEILPLALSISLLSSPYAWLYDQSLLLIAQVYLFYKLDFSAYKIGSIQGIYLLIKSLPNTAQQHFALLLPLWTFLLKSNPNTLSDHNNP